MREENMAEENVVDYETVAETSSLFKDFYPIKPPYGYVGIEIDEDTEKLKYVLLEPTLNEMEIQFLGEIKNDLTERMDIPLSTLKNKEKMKDYLRNQIDRVLERFKRKVAQESQEKYIYYLMRDFLGYGKIDLIMNDPKIEDISCNGVNTPIYVWHQNYESIQTNIAYLSETELDNIVRRLAYRTGRQISVSNPIVEGTLPEGYRVHLTLDEVSKRGDTFTIRKFRSNPYTIIDLINFGTLSPQIGAYLWVLVENLRSIMICGATASGKTALLNSISMFIKPEMKVVTIEEVQELRLHENWIPLVTRPSYQPGVQEVSTFDLLKSALRQRPDYIIVGEVRGEEAYTLFQSIAVGHGGLCTIHADSLNSVIKRLMSKPMNVPEMMLSLMNVLIQIGRVKVDDRIIRRVVTVAEITGLPVSKVSKDQEIVQIQKIFEWDAENDGFVYNAPDEIDTLLGEDKDIFTLISEINHVSVDKLKEEQSRREIILKWMAKSGLNTYEDVAKVVRDYYQNPNEVYNSARAGVKK
jgi:flagellar protein FlaI